MTTWLGNLWERLRSSFWFVPGLLTLLAIGLSVATIALDDTVKGKVLENLGWLWAGGPEGARELLSTIAGSMITVAGVTFSITIVALSLASSQFGSRVLRNFMRDTGNQVVLGTFIATFVYCLLVLRTVRTGNGGSDFVPYVSVTVGMGLGLASIGVLIYFIHHVAVSIQASQLVARVGRELEQAIDSLFPERIGERGGESPGPRRPDEVPRDFERRAQPVCSRTSGYVQAVDGDTLMRLACERSLLVRIERRPGEFVAAETPLLRVWAAEPVDGRVAEELAGAVIVGRQRTSTQDAMFVVDQIAQVAVRALSPGINDPFTAMTCIDWLGSALTALARRRLPSPFRYDGTDTLRVIGRPVCFGDFLDAAFTEIRRYGRRDEAVLVRLLETLAAIAERVCRDDDRTTLREHANRVERDGRAGLADEDHVRFDAQYQATIQAIERAAVRAHAQPEPPAAQQHRTG